MFNEICINEEMLPKYTYIYIYIYTVIHKQTVSLYHNSSVGLDSRDASSQDQNPPNFTSGR